MKIVNVLTGFTLVLLITTSAVNADDKKDTAETKVDSTSAVKTDDKKDTAEAKVKPDSTAGFSYRPPMRGAPASRIGGGTRGVGDTTLELVVLAPDHTGLTTKEQPTLYWYVSEAVPARLEVTLINDVSIEPELEQVVATPGHAGIQSIDLGNTETRLEPGKEYRWFVSVVSDPERRSTDVIASGTIQRIKPNEAFKDEIAGADEYALAGIYAKQGVWYDAIDSLTRMIDKLPADTVLQHQRTVLLEQVGLQDAANYTRTHN